MGRCIDGVVGVDADRSGSAASWWSGSYSGWRSTRQSAEVWGGDLWGRMWDRAAMTPLELSIPAPRSAELGGEGVRPGGWQIAQAMLGAFLCGLGLGKMLWG